MSRAMFVDAVFKQRHSKHKHSLACRRKREEFYLWRLPRRVYKERCIVETPEGLLRRKKKRLKRFDQLVGKNLAKHQTQALSGDFQHMHLTKCTHECAMCIFLFLKIFNFIKEIVHIYIVFFKKVKTIVFVLNLLTCSKIYNF